MNNFTQNRFSAKPQWEDIAPEHYLRDPRESPQHRNVDQVFIDTSKRIWDNAEVEAEMLRWQYSFRLCQALHRFDELSERRMEQLTRTLDERMERLYRELDELLLAFSRRLEAYKSIGVEAKSAI